METFFWLWQKNSARLLNLMREDEICVCFFTEVLDESQPKISDILHICEMLELVRSRREGKWMHYRIMSLKTKLPRRVLRETLEWFEKSRRYAERLRKIYVACCGVSDPVTIIRAPKPETFAQTNMSYERRRIGNLFVVIYLSIFVRDNDDNHCRSSSHVF